MLWRVLLVFSLLFAVSVRAQAQAVPPTPAPPAATVVEQSQDIQVGDVIMAPRIEGHDDEDEPGREPPPRKAQPRRWYGGPILIADGLAFGSIALAASVEGSSGVTLPLGVGTFLLAGPIVHGTQRQWGRLGLSLAARTVLPFAGLVLGAGSCAGESDCSSALAGLTVAGMLAASIVDASALAYAPVAESPSIQPSVSLSQDRVWLGASGTF